MEMMKWLVFLAFQVLLFSCSLPRIESVTPTFQPINPTPTPEQDAYFKQRQKLVVELKTEGIHDEAVLDAMASVPRHEFVLPDYLDQAYANHPLPIGYGQTISQPFIVAWMTELLELQPGEKVLEIGTGSGYQAAILAELEDLEIYTVEIVPELAKSAAERLEKLGYQNVKTRQGDGYYGWEEYAPYDAIIVTAAPDHLPAPLVNQLTPDGRIVIPLGPPGWVQTLWKFVMENGELKGYNLGGVSFVPFTGSGIDQNSGEAIPMP